MHIHKNCKHYSTHKSFKVYSYNTVEGVCLCALANPEKVKKMAYKEKVKWKKLQNELKL